jgi:CAAX prenyl protease-like protein
MVSSFDSLQCGLITSPSALPQKPTSPIPHAAAGNPAIPYVAPFIAFIALMVLERMTTLSPEILYPLRFSIVLSILLVVSRRVIPVRAAQPLGSVLLGLTVFVIWVAPDVLFGYRGHWLFENPVLGKAESSLAPALKANLLFIAIRVAGSVLLVPILEELFWRGWLMRWLIHHDFLRVPLGAYSRSAFWIVALLFASEHGPYWEVGLAAGLIYNWWLVRTRNLADCILAHAVTNFALAGYVLATDQWQYWL